MLWLVVFLHIWASLPQIQSGEMVSFSMQTAFCAGGNKFMRWPMISLSAGAITWVMLLLRLRLGRWQLLGLGRALYYR